MEDPVYSKLREIDKRYQEVNALLVDEETLKNPKELTRLSKEEARLKQPVDAWKELQDLDGRLAEAEEMTKETDPELREMAKEEAEECTAGKEVLLARIQQMLIPRDPDDDHNVIMEIRGGVGGDEGNIFAGDLYRMYTRYAETKGWKVQVMEASDSEAGGFSQIIFSIKGKDVYRDLKFESGAHRVQRDRKSVV